MADFPRTRPARANRSHAIAVAGACIEDLMSGRHQQQVKTEQTPPVSSRCIGW
jgi:hypothetical protein